MIYKLEIRRVALDMTIFSIDDDVAGKVPDAIFEIELACTALVGLDTDASLCQSQATKHQHRTLAIVVRRVRIEGDRQPEVIDLSVRSTTQQQRRQR